MVFYRVSSPPPAFYPSRESCEPKWENQIQHPHLPKFPASGGFLLKRPKGLPLQMQLRRDRWCGGFFRVNPSSTVVLLCLRNSWGTQFPYMPLRRFTEKPAPRRSAPFFFALFLGRYKKKGTEMGDVMGRGKFNYRSGETARRICFGPDDWIARERGTDWKAKKMATDPGRLLVRFRGVTGGYRRWR